MCAEYGRLDVAEFLLYLQTWERCLSAKVDSGVSGRVVGAFNLEPRLRECCRLIRLCGADLERGLFAENGGESDGSSDN